MLFNILALVSFLIVLLCLKRLVNIFPSLLACLIRWKESLNLESSVKLSLDRDLLTMCMMIPFCLVAYSYRLYDPGFMDGMGGNAALGVCFAVFGGYVLMRKLMEWLFRPDRIPQKIFIAGVKVGSSFFVMYTLMLLAMGAVLGIMNLSDEDIRCAMLWLSALMYVVLMLRKMQIFASSCSVFTAFLYLCALEMIPTGILMVSAIIF